MVSEQGTLPTLEYAVLRDAGGNGKNIQDFLDKLKSLKIPYFRSGKPTLLLTATYNFLNKRYHFGI